MMEDTKYKIYLSPPFQSGRELEYLKKVLESNWLAPGGEFVQSLEDLLKSITQREYCVALNSGTAAIHLALKVLGVDYGDHVLCQTFSFVATANPIAYLGATPVFIDSEQDTWNMDPLLLEDAIKDLLKNDIRPKAIIYTHIYGNPAKAKDIFELGKKYDIAVIEDAAEALGARLYNKPAGCHGDISIVSFNGNKVVTTSGGGALITDNKEFAMNARILATQARDREAAFTHTQVGYNYQMSNLSAALGLAQMPELESWVKKKRSIHDNYHEFLERLGQFESVSENLNEYSCRWLSVFLAPDIKTRERIISNLNDNKIESRRFWKPLHLLNIFKSRKAYISDVSNTLFEKGFCLPSGVGLTENEQGEIKRIIKLSY